jgi:NADH dehydrogenase [ubiquinone] 1 alpha subcomplex assembly factor 7
MTTTSLEIVLTNSGLDTDGQLQIREAMHPFWLQAQDWQAKVATVTDPKIARASRLTLKKIRVDAEHKKAELKEHILVRGRAIDAAFRAIESTILPLEEQLDVIEKAEARRLAAEAQARADARRAELAALEFSLVGIDLGKLSDADYAALKTQAQSALDTRREVERVKAEAKRAEEERLRLVAEAEQKAKAEAWAVYEAQRKAQYEENAKRRAEADAALAEERRLREEAEAKAKAEELARKAVEEKAREEAEARAAAERKAREEAEARAAAERKAREEAEAKVRAAAEAAAAEAAAKAAAEARAAAEAAARAEEERQRLNARPDVEKLVDAVKAVEMSVESLRRLPMTTPRGLRLSSAVYATLSTAVRSAKTTLEAAR